MHRGCALMHGRLICQTSRIARHQKVGLSKGQKACVMHAQICLICHCEDGNYAGRLGLCYPLSLCSPEQQHGSQVPLTSGAATVWPGNTSAATISGGSARRNTDTAAAKVSRMMRERRGIFATTCRNQGCNQPCKMCMLQSRVSSFLEIL